MFQVTVVCETRLSFIVNADLDVPIRDLELAREAGQRPQSPDCIVFGCLDLAQAQQRLAQLGREQCRQRASFRRFDPDRVNAGGLRVHPNSVQQYGLPDSAEADQHSALGRPADPRAFQRDTEGRPQQVAPCKLRRGRACTRCEWIANRVHAAIVARLGRLSSSNNLRKIA